MARAALSRRAAATSEATAQDARRVSRESARLVRMIGTRAPSTMPAASAPARKDRLLASMLPASRSGTTSTFARPATGETMLLDGGRLAADGVVERQRTIQHRTSDLTAIGHLAQGGGLDRGGHIGVDDLHRAEDGDAYLGKLNGVGEVDRVLHDVDLVP